MSSLKYAIVEEEMVTSVVDSVAEEKHPKPVLVHRASERPGDTLIRRVEAILDAVFKNGNMPA
ncbi:MAG TPA: hypothetical protein VMU45_10450 [Candidatus Eisenbacteria bacterium]|nr:hypothetical protein [Candidatus Eisenbacteria bacterium]